MKVPVLVMIQFPVDYFPAHGFLDDIKVIWHVLFRDRVFEVVMTVKSIDMLKVRGSQKNGEKCLHHKFLKYMSQRRVMGEKCSRQNVINHFRLPQLSRFPFLYKFR